MNSTAASFLGSCPLPLNQTFISAVINSVPVRLPFELWEQSLSNLRSCSIDTGGYTYLRPDEGVALQPWVFIGSQIVFHLPTCVIRLARWERVQWLSIGIATVNLIIITQAFVATGLKPEEVLVWTPIVLVLDAGKADSI